MSRSINFFVFGIVLLAFSACRQNKPEYEQISKGCWKKLLAFNSEDSQAKNGHAWLSASFNTMSDSVFFDSGNDLRDRYFINSHSASGSLLVKGIQSLGEGDSAVFLIETERFFKEQFQSERPFFAVKDSVVKVYVRVKKIYSDDEFGRLNTTLGNDELAEISSFFQDRDKLVKAQDPAGFYWVEKPDSLFNTSYTSGEVIHLTYSGGFLNGRIIDHASDFAFVYGTPDQILKGLNYVIPRLKKGQTTKIILPSHLAFGETGSSNGSVPPYTPMLYTLRIN